MKSLFTLLILLLVTNSSCSQVETLLPDKKKKVDRLFERWNKSNSPGMAIGIISKGKMIYAKGYGLASLEHSITNSSKTVFNIASNSKQFTAACIAILQSKGKLNVNQTLKNFFPDFSDYAKDITIKHLLHHTSGIRDFSQITYLSGLRPDDYYNDNDILSWINNQKSLNFPPGEQFLYSNSNYWLLGKIVEKVTKMSLADFAHKEIFEPLQMVNTRFIDNNSIIINNRASGYSSIRSGGFRNIISTLEHTGNGGVYTSVQDLDKWVNAYFNKTILNDAFWKLMTTKGTLKNEKTIDYAWGLEIQKYKGLNIIEHGGRVPGYLSEIIRFPDQNFSVIVLTNVSNTNATQLGYQIADIFLKDQFKEVDFIIPKDPNFIKLPNQVLKQYQGTYWNAKDGYSRELMVKNDTLHYMRSSRNTNKLVPVSKNKFKMINTPPEMNVYVEFSKNDMMSFIENGKTVASFNKYTLAIYDDKELQNYTGIYYSEEIDTKYEIKQNKNNLQLFINGRRSVFLQPIMTNVFNSPMALFLFKGNNKNINDFTVSTPRVKNIVFKRIQ
ncbi:serine hydrolase domain-containing protein [Aquimarina sp. 2201CG5-10]|uniref:serine hydrolase domain-containing protein n=1 Tax=Aquimarina callyspongiae TaxID=3098150 RepID=UPI002AB3C631|nr:serine hydrolase domain-containing protein [Aquimarina sp. 2201CG5-10]MDY8135955.1 serine hydrolase domain-containing protein [Aquimarina sp. 2201CG5-10]